MPLHSICNWLGFYYHWQSGVYMGKVKKFQPMLAEKIADINELVYPVIASPKLDGIRCVIVDGQPLTRKLKPIPNLYIRKNLEGLPELDGEILIYTDDRLLGLKSFNDTQSAVMREDGEPHFVYHVFDCFKQPELGFSGRLDIARAYISVAHANSGFYRYVQPLMHHKIREPERLGVYEEQCLIEGHEGVMIRHPAGPYKFGRSTKKEAYLLKLKRFSDLEGKVIGFKQRMHNANEQTVDERGYSKRSSHKAGKVPMDQVGSFILQMENGKEFDCGSGLTEAQRKKYWKEQESLLGKFITVRYQHLTEDGVPRFPVFVGFRDERDM